MDTPVVFHARGLTKVYRMGEVEVAALRGVDLDLYAGEFVVLLGPSGSGKSTLLNILGGLDMRDFGRGDATPSRTSRVPDDRELTAFRRDHVGFVFQFYNLIPSLTARENVAAVTEIARSPMRPEAALELVGMGARLDHFPAQLSGGEQQRVAIARAIAKQPGGAAVRRADWRARLDDGHRRARGAGERQPPPRHHHRRDHPQRGDRRDGRPGDPHGGWTNRGQRAQCDPQVAAGARVVMRALDRKLWRDLWHLRGMVAAISLVLLGGISTFVMSRVTYESLATTQQRYYADQHFADLFVGLVRAPEALAGRLADVPGVDRVETRVVAAVNLEIPGYDEPVTGRIHLAARAGWAPAQRAVVEARTLARSRFGRRGDRERGIRRGTGPGARGFAGRRSSRAAARPWPSSGSAISPEYMYAIPPGAIFPDHERYAILWMSRRALATAFDMEGAFNDASFSLQPGARQADVIDAIDDLLDRYGGLGAYAREDQLSHRFITEELRSLQTMATVFPVIFLGVAAFLLNVVVTRLVSLERDQIGTLKAFGYGTDQIVAHYLKLVLAMVAAGLVAGIGLGLWFARGMAGIYQVFYSFPYLHLVLDPGIFGQALAVTIAAALAGTLLAVRRAAALPPAVAMRPEPPPVYRATLFERAGLARRLAEPSRMILRHIARRPLKSALTVAGIAAATGILMITNFQRDAIAWMVDVQYRRASREDMTVMFTEPTPRRALYSLSSLDGVEHAEGFRAVPARLVFGHRSYRTAVEGVEPGAELQRVLDARLQPVRVPDEGVVLTEFLATRILGIRRGDTLVIEVLEGRRPVLEVPVVGIAEQYIGVNAYMSREALNRLLQEGPAISGARLAVDAARERELYRELRAMPRVAGTVVRDNSIRQFNEMMQETILFFSFITALLGGFIAFGVVYNSARIALSERGRELASLRVLGFTRAEAALHPARRDRAADPRGGAARLPVRLRALGLSRRRLCLRPLSRGTGRRAGDLRARGECRAGVVRRQQPVHLAQDRPPRPGRGAEDPGVDRA